MRTQADDLKAQIREVNQNMAYLESLCIDAESEIYKYLSNRKDTLVSTLNNIR